jgi:hypothetical protein
LLEHTAALAFLHDLSVVLDAGRCRGEDESVLSIQVGVEDQREVIAVAQRDVADLLARNDAGRLAIEEPGADIECFAVGEESDLVRSVTGSPSRNSR